MFLIRLIYLNGFKPKDDEKSENLLNKNDNQKKDMEATSKLTNNQIIDQIKNVAQEKKIKIESRPEIKATNEILISSFSELIEICSLKKEMKLKYELEKNVNLVRFENGRIEISFNDNLDQNFVKDLTIKLLEWTNKRWIISFSKNMGQMSIKDKEKNEKLKLIDNVKKTHTYKLMLDYFSDAELIDFKIIKKDEE